MSKGAIVAIGGGSPGTPVYYPSTWKIDRITVALAEKRRQHDGRVRVLYVPTANYDDPIRCREAKKYWVLDLGCKMRTLLLTRKYTAEEVASKVQWADIIYVGGGNTRYMMEMWRRAGLDKLLVGAYERGAVLTGMSAGSICWFKGGWSDAEDIEGYNPWYPVWVAGLGIINALHSPHFETKWRKEKTAEGPEGVTIALDNDAAIVVEDGMYRVVSSAPGACAYRCERTVDGYEEKVLPQEEPRSLADILS